MDKLAAEGENGMMDPIAPGIRAGSDTSHLAILGYDPYTYTPAEVLLKRRVSAWMFAAEISPSDATSLP